MRIYFPASPPTRFNLTPTYPSDLYIYIYIYGACVARLLNRHGIHYCKIIEPIFHIMNLSITSLNFGNKKAYHFSPEIGSFFKGKYNNGLKWTN